MRIKDFIPTALQGTVIAILAGSLGLGLGAPVLAQEEGEVLRTEPASCIVGLEEEPKPGVPGKNGPECKGSPYNCRIMPTGFGNRIPGSTYVSRHGERKPTVWSVSPGEAVLDGEGQPLLEDTEKTFYTFNYGQKETFGERDFVFALSTGNSSAGWVPLDAVRDDPGTAVDERILLEAHAGFTRRPAGAHDLSEMACFEVADKVDPDLVELKLVYDSSSRYERAGDYLPLRRNNGERSANLVYNVPGCSMGGTAINHFRAGTKFRRLDVPTSTGKPYLAARLWDRDKTGAYRKYVNDMAFFYGYVVTPDNERRAGWMAKDALVRSSGCP